MNVDKEVRKHDIWIGEYVEKNVKITKLKRNINIVIAILFGIGLIMTFTNEETPSLWKFILFWIGIIAFLIMSAFYSTRIFDHKAIIDDKTMRFLNTILEFSDGALIPRYMFIDPNETTLNEVVINPNRDAHVINKIELEKIVDISDENLKLKAKIDNCLINYGIKNRNELGRMVYEKGKINQAIIDNESERAYEMYFKEIHQQQQQVLKNEPQSYNELDLDKVKHKLDNAKAREVDDMKKANDENSRIMQEW